MTSFIGVSQLFRSSSGGFVNRLILCTLNYIQADIFDSPPSHDSLGESDNLMDVQHRNAHSLNSKEESKRIKLPIHILTIHKMARISSDIVSEP